MTYCTDIDLLTWEPNLFKDAALAGQTLGAGTGTLDGVHFTRSVGSFIDENIKDGCVLALQGDYAGCYPVVSLASATQLVVSVNDQSYNDTGAASPIGSAANIAFVVRTFYPQRKMISELINNAAGIGAGTPLPEAMLIPSPGLKRACAQGTLQTVYGALASMSVESERLLNRAEFYRGQFLRALRRLSIEIDVDADGKCDIVRKLGSLTLRRA